MLVDSHAHILSEYYENIDLVVKESKDNNVHLIINNGCDEISNNEVLSLIDKYSEMYGAIGIHPETVDSYKDEDISFIVNNISNKKIVAIGEIGLDYYYSKDNKEKQIELFERQLKLAEDNNIPVIVHSREATLDTINSLKKYKCRGVIHSFSGSYETAMIYIKMGYLLGINGVITFKNANIKDVIKRLPLSSLVLETDSPYLTPVPFRGQQNSPKHIKDTAEFVADLFNIDISKLAKITTNNVLRIFDKIS